MRYIYILLLLCSCVFEGLAQKTFVYSNPKNLEEVGAYADIFEDVSKTYTVDMVRAQTQTLFRPNDKSFLNFQNNPNPIWIRFLIQNSTNEELLIEFGNAELEHIDLYVKDENDQIKAYKSGSFEPFNTRFFKNSSITVSLGFHPKEVLIRNQTNTSFSYPLFCGTLKAIAEHHHKSDVFDGAYLGLMLTLLIYNFFIFYRLRESMFLFYCGYVVTQCLAVLRFKGLAYDIFWPNMPIFNHWPNFVPAISGISVVWFSVTFLNLQKEAPRFVSFFKGMIFLFLVAIVLDILGIQPWANVMLQSLVTLAAFVILGIVTYMYVKGFSPARYYLVAWIGLIFGSLMLTFSLNNIIPYGSFFNISAFQLSSAWQAVFGSLALADKVQLYVAEKSKLKELRTVAEMKALRAQMNPHFIFNCMNTIEAFILENKPRDASAFLQKFSKLTRRILEHSEHELVSLEKDVDSLKLYIELEKIRYNASFDHEIIFSFDEQKTHYLVPPLLVQPFVENAILHGLRYKSNERGLLTVKYTVEKESLICDIIDNGIGRKESEALKAKSPIKRKSMGMRITNDRIAVINGSYSQGASLVLSDVVTGGTKASLKLPLLVDI